MKTQIKKYYIGFQKLKETGYSQSHNVIQKRKLSARYREHIDG